MLAGLAFITRSRLPADSSVGDTFQLVAIALLTVGIVGLHALHKDHYGRIGLVIGLAGLSIVVTAASVSVVARIVKLLSGNEAFVWITDLALPALMLGMVLYGVATLLARVLSLWVGVAIMVALPLRIALVVIDPWGLTLFGLLWVAVGYVLWSRRKAATEQPVRIS
jgi:hypothetical protein